MKSIDESLCLAARNGNMNIVKSSSRKNASLHAENDLALRYAAHYGHLDIVKYLVENKADIHAKNDLRASSSQRK